MASQLILKRTCQNFLLETIAPNVALTVTLKQAMYHPQTCLLESLDTYKAEGIAKKLMRRISRKILHQTARRYRVLLPHAVAVEGQVRHKFDGKNIHLHLAINFPSRCRPQEILNAIYWAIKKDHWCGEQFDIQFLYKPKGWLGYLSKYSVDNISWQNVFTIEQFIERSSSAYK